MPRSKGFIVAMDGPSGAGKSTIAKLLAKKLGGTLLDTGAMYRAVGYYALKENAATKKDFGKIAERMKFKQNNYGTLLVNGRNLGRKLRTEKVSAMASFVSKYKEVRAVLTAKQRTLGKQMAKTQPVVVEGRDIGTVVFPDKRGVYRFFITANAIERAKRRQKQLEKLGEKTVTISAVLLKQAHRDRQDSTRKLAPLKKATDTITVNTSRKKVNEVVDSIISHLPVG